MASASSSFINAFTSKHSHRQHLGACALGCVVEYVCVLYVCVLYVCVLYVCVLYVCCMCVDQSLVFGSEAMPFGCLFPIHLGGQRGAVCCSVLQCRC